MESHGILQFHFAGRECHGVEITTKLDHHFKRDHKFLFKSFNDIKFLLGHFALTGKYTDCQTALLQTPFGTETEWQTVITSVQVSVKWGSTCTIICKIIRLTLIFP